LHSYARLEKLMRMQKICHAAILERLWRSGCPSWRLGSLMREPHSGVRQSMRKVLDPSIQVLHLLDIHKLNI